jgi:hypothetical protein
VEGCSEPISSEKGSHSNPRTRTLIPHNVRLSEAGIYLAVLDGVTLKLHHRFTAEQNCATGSLVILISCRE